MRPLMNVNEVKDVLSVGRSTVYELMNQGEIESIKIGRSRRIIPESLDAYIERIRG